ncbi:MULTISPECIES: hypothetical protein [Chryseobacterium]|uniref:hypothetical protein n=1 Tax=Chryseobacterium TaxID=59732 RepID=UPI0028A05D7F|nr:hypothetical protein [Chryseobacterium sp.]
MKSLKEFITENLENSTVTTVQESTEKQVDENNNLEEGQEATKLNEELDNKMEK